MTVVWRIAFAAINGRSSTQLHLTRFTCRSGAAEQIPRLPVPTRENRACREPLRAGIFGRPRLLCALRLGTAGRWIGHSAIGNQHSAISGKIEPKEVNGFWVAVCQYVPFRAETLAKNPMVNIPWQ